jgi:hypothetical protein
MKTQQLKTPWTFVILKAGLVAGLLSFGIGASADSDAEVIYQPSTAHHSIYSYPSNVPGIKSISPQIIYVSQAYAPAVYSYPHSGEDTVRAFNVEYVDTAYGPAIYSYPRNKGKSSSVEVLPIQTTNAARWEAE